jgi:sulfite exporter TauE/SafE/copper chaperone CopZ
MTDQTKIQNKTHTFHVHGMHCSACVLLTESEIMNLPNVTHAKSNLERNSIEVTGDFGDKTPEQIAKEFSASLKPHGYSVSVEKQIVKVEWSDFAVAAPIAFAFVALFIFLQELGIVSFINVGDIGYGTAFVIGIIASLSTCVAVVGGLVLSMSATFAKAGDKVRPQLMFHIGRLFSFFVLGGIIGLLGTAFTPSIVATFVLTLIIGLVMLVLGVNLLDVFPWMKKLQPSMPKFIVRRAYDVSKINHTLTPFLVGIATFFLPCGFTQSMQLYALATGSFLEGGLTMLAFALGTLPVLALVSFSALSIHKSARAGVFFKAAGLIVIFFAVITIVNSFAAIGFIPPIFIF